MQFADAAVADQLAGVAEVLRGALLAAGLEDGVVSPGGLDHLACVADGQREGLFAVDVLAGSAGRDGDDGVPVVGDGDQHGVDVVARQQLFVFVVGITAVESAGGGFGGVVLLGALGGFVALPAFHVANGDDLHFLVVEEVVQVAAAHVADADETHRDTLAGCGTGAVPQGGGGDERGHREGAGGFQKLPPGCAGGL